MVMTTHTFPNPQQQGVALVIAMILLIVLTLLGLSALKTTIVETKLATNAQERAYAFQMAETAVSEKENLFSNAGFMGRLILSDSLQITSADGDVDFPEPAVIARDPATGINSITQTGATLMEFRGTFEVPPGAAGSNWGVGVADGSYFEVYSIGRNNEEDSGFIHYTVRSGYRQLAPKDSSTKTVPTSMLGMIGY
jgi:hypothetical protein